MTSLHIWPILVASVVAFGIGALWYSPILFGKEWMALTKTSEADIATAKGSSMVWRYIVQFIITVVTFALLAFVMSITGSDTAGEGMFIAVLAWIGFPVMAAIGDMLWQKKPAKLAVITLLGTLVCWLAGGAIIAAWR